MKKCFAALLALVMTLSLMALPAGAITTGKWDFQAGLDYAQGVIQGLPEYTPPQDPEIPEFPAQPEGDCPVWVAAAWKMAAIWLNCWEKVAR